MAEQLVLPGVRASRLPFLVRHNRVGRAARRALETYASGSCDVVSRGFRVRALVEDLALLAELRARSRAVSGKGCGRAAVFASTLAGRRVHQMIDQVSARIEAQELALCG